MYRMKDSYTPTDAKRANDELDRLVTTRSMTGWSSSEAHRTSRSACSEGHVLDSGGTESESRGGHANGGRNNHTYIVGRISGAYHQTNGYGQLIVR
jgi:hypothetical protein